MKEKYKNILLLIGTIVIVLIIFEIILRVAKPENYTNTKDFVEFSDVYGWKIKPNMRKTMVIADRNCLVETNSLGLRDYEHNITKSDKYRILIAGDSFTWGTCVDNNELYSKVLETYDEKIETINMGILGYGTDQEYLKIMNDGLKYNPDAVILMFTISTDVGDTKSNSNVIYDKNVEETENKIWYKPMFVIENNELVLTNSPVPEQKVKVIGKKQNPIKSLALYSFMRDRIAGFPPIRNFLLKRFNIGRYYDKKENYDVAFKILSKLSEELKSRNIKFVVIIMPDKGQLKGGIGDTSIYIMEDFLKENDIEFINIYEHWEGEDPYDYYFRIDGHISEKGHKDVARIIYKSDVWWRS